MFDMDSAYVQLYRLLSAYENICIVYTQYKFYIYLFIYFIYSTSFFSPDTGTEE